MTKKRRIIKTTKIRRKKPYIHVELPSSETKNVSEFPNGTDDAPFLPTPVLEEDGFVGNVRGSPRLSYSPLVEFISVENSALKFKPVEVSRLEPKPKKKAKFKCKSELKYRKKSSSMARLKCAGATRRSRRLQGLPPLDGTRYSRRLQGLEPCSF